MADAAPVGAARTRGPIGETVSAGRTILADLGCVVVVVLASRTVCAHFAVFSVAPLALATS